MPECAYLIGNVKVGKNREMIWDDETDEDLIGRIADALTAAGFTGTEPEPAEETDEATEDAAKSDRPDCGADFLASNGNLYDVTVHYNSDALIPEGSTTLQVTEIEQGTQAYENLAAVWL